MNLIRADADLGAEAIALAIRHARRCVPVHARGVDARDEALSVPFVEGQDRIRVVRGMLVDMLDGGFEIRHRLDCENEVEELGVVVLGSRCLK